MTRRDMRQRQRLDPAQRRAAIQAAADEVFNELGWAGATLAEIAGRSQSSEALIYRYFTSKEQLYAEWVQQSVDDLQAKQRDAVSALPPNTSSRDLIRAVLMVQLDAVAAHPEATARPLRNPGNEPAVVEPILANARQEFGSQLRSWLPQHTIRHGVAIDGFLGFMDAAVAAWAIRGCPADEYHSLIDAALGALQGAMGDWG